MCESPDMPDATRRDADRLHWVALDTNVLGRGTLQVSQLETLASELADAGIELLVHEVVLWEWAEHAHSTLLELSRTAKQLARVLRSAALGSLLDHEASSIPEADVAEVVDRMRESFAAIPNVVVVAGSPEGALRGLRAQVLLEGAGRRKNEVKTGAADMGQVFDLLQYVKPNYSALAIYSQDADIDAAIDLLCRGAQPQRFRSQGEVLAAARGMVPKPATPEEHASVEKAVARFVTGQLKQPEASEDLRAWGAIQSEKLGQVEALGSRRWYRLETDAVTGLAAVQTVKIEVATANSSPRLFTCNVKLVANLVGEYLSRTEIAEELEVFPWSGDDIVLEVDVAGLLVAGQAKDLRPIGTARVVDAPSWFPSMEAAKEALVGALAAAPLFGDEAWWHDVLHDSVPDDVPKRFDWTRNEFLDDEGRYEIGFVVDGAEQSVVLEVEPYLYHRGKAEVVEVSSTIESERRDDQARTVNGPIAVAADLVRRWYAGESPP